MQDKKIGIVTDDGRTVSPQFGMARCYLVFEIDDDMIEGKEMRPKASHRPERGVMHHRVEENSLHEDMLSNVRDCQVLVTGRMGRPI